MQTNAQTLRPHAFFFDGFLSIDSFSMAVFLPFKTFDKNEAPTLPHSSSIFPVPCSLFPYFPIPYISLTSTSSTKLCANGCGEGGDRIEIIRPDQTLRLSGAGLENRQVIKFGILAYLA